MVSKTILVVEVVSCVASTVDLLNTHSGLWRQARLDGERETYVKPGSHFLCISCPFQSPFRAGKACNVVPPEYSSAVILLRFSRDSG